MDRRLGVRTLEDSSEAPTGNSTPHRHWREEPPQQKINSPRETALAAEVGRGRARRGTGQGSPFYTFTVGDE